MNRQYFFKELSSRLYPLLRSEGFRGSGVTMRRVADPLVHIFNVQGSDGACYLNLGVHLTFLPTEGGLPAQAGDLKEYQCAFRGRIDPPPGPAYGWSYGLCAHDVSESVELICEEWRLTAIPFFASLGTYPDSFLTLVTAAPPESVHPIVSRTYARIAFHLGLTNKAIAFAQSGLERAPEKALGLREDLSTMIRTGSAA